MGIDRARLWDRAFTLRAARRLSATPVFTAFSLLSISIGVGMSTSVYSVVRSLAWQSPGIRNVGVLRVVRGGRGVAAFSESELQRFEAQQTSFSAIASTEPVRVACARGEIVDSLDGEAVNGTYFATFGAQAIVGRLIRETDLDPAAPAVAVFSEKYWRSRFGSDVAIVGSLVKVAGRPHDVIGVVRAPFSGALSNTPSDIWIPRQPARREPGDRTSESAPRDLDLRRLTVFGWLRPGRTIREAAAEVSLIGSRSEVGPSPDGSAERGSMSWSVVEAGKERWDPGRSALGLLIVGGVVVLLAIASTNIASLALARGSARAREFAIRASLGASRAQLVWEQVLESIPIVSAGACGGYLIARAAVWALPRVNVGTWTRGRLNPELDVHALGFGLGALALVLLVCGVWPALQLTRAPSRGSSLSGGVATTRWRMLRQFVTWQVAGSVALFLVAAVCVRATLAITSHDSGIDTERLAVLQVDFKQSGRDEAQARNTITSVLERLRAHPRIEEVAVSIGFPYGVGFFTGWVTTPASPFVRERDRGEPTYQIASTSSLLRTLGVRIRRGRTFDDEDPIDARASVVVSASLALAVFGTEDVLGRELLFSLRSRLSEPDPVETLTIVGVVSDTDTFQLTSRGHLIYLPLAHRYRPRVTFTTRSANPTLAAAEMLSALRSVDPELAVTTVGPATRVLMSAFALLRVLTAIAVVVGSLAGVLVVSGLIGVLCHSVALRRREFAVRVALGASAKRIQILVMLSGLRPVGDGLVLGFVAGAVGRMAVQPLIQQRVTPLDALVLVLVPLPLLLVAAFACYLPARRAAGADPTEALREL